MKKIIFAITALSFLLLTPITHADQGMWLPSLVGKERIKDMQREGLKLNAKDLYDINSASLKDAIVRFGGGCTGELISDQGLLITNHHCGYSQIQSHSTIEKDYLTHGFVARDKSQELPNPGLKVYSLQSMDDVTEQVMAGVKQSMTKTLSDTTIQRNIRAIKARSVKGQKGVEATVEPLYYGNQYYLFVYKVYSDVRLVFAPASSIGKFGGDTDNWMWPRHSGDFSVFRVYADKNNNPADYSPDNVPYTPRKSLVISTKGVDEGDFTFVYGYPARTQQYLHSAAIKYITQMGDPVKIELRTKRLEIMNAAQEADPVVRIKYSAKNASVSNAWKKWQGELLGLQRLGTYEKKQSREKQFEQWAADKAHYAGLTSKLQALYDSLQPYALATDLYAEAPMAIELVKFAAEYIKADAKPDYATFYKNYEKSIDSTTALYLFEQFIQKVPAGLGLEQITDPQAVVAEIFGHSLFLDSAQLKVATRVAIQADPAYKLALALTTKRKSDVTPEFMRLNAAITDLYATYMRGLMEFDPAYPFFPDANSTLRIAYGKVKGYEPRDAVYYRPVSTLDGVMQKDNPAIYDYDVPEKLREIYSAKDYGRWAVNGSIPVGFIATNHTTGGNSGSPVLNANGELIGLNFDRTWEGTMSDLEYDPVVCRNISLDIRYVLFLMDRLYGASYLFDEMRFAQ